VAERLQIDLDRIQSFELLAETRLLAMLADVRRNQERIDLTSQFDIDVAQRSIRRLVDLFGDTLAGIVLAQMASSIVDGSGEDQKWRIGRFQVDQALQNDYSFGTGEERSAPMVDFFGGPPPAELVADTVGTEFDPLFRAWLAALNFEDLHPDYVDALAEFAYEAFDNTRRHGVRTLDGRPIEGVRFLLLRAKWINPDSIAELAEDVAYPPISRYLGRLGRKLTRPVRLAELTVADCGEGIAATLASSTSVYEGDHNAERALIEESFERGRTSRRGHRRAGQGLAKALRATQHLHGLIAVRTGRTHLYRDFTESSAVWRSEEVTRLPGTALSLIFPWRDQSQLVLEGLD
jgi:hypothetical protein